MTYVIERGYAQGENSLWDDRSANLSSKKIKGHQL